MLSSSEFGNPTGEEEEEEEVAENTEFRDIHALSSVSGRSRRRRSSTSEVSAWESVSTAIMMSQLTDPNRTAVVEALRQRQEEEQEWVDQAAMDALAIVPESIPVQAGFAGVQRDVSPSAAAAPPSRSPSAPARPHDDDVTPLFRVKKEEVESKILAWQTAEIATINNRYKRQDVIIAGWENERIRKAEADFKKIERKLEEKRARAVEKMENDVAKTRRKAEERRATAEAKRGAKVAGILDLAKLMRTMGKSPSKRSFF